MTDMKPPALATWILKRVARRNDALVGDLFEEYGRRRSTIWYWRQVLTAVCVAASKEALLVFGIAALLLLGAFVPVPGAHAGLLDLASRPAMGNRTWNLLLPSVPGWQLSGITIFALGIAPYVSASLIVQLAAFFWNLLNRNATRRLVPTVTATWCVAIGLSLTQGAGLANFLVGVSAAAGWPPIVDSPGLPFFVTMSLAITIGTACLMFISDQITKRRMGNGMLVVFVAAALAALPASLWPILSGVMDPLPLLRALMLNAVMVGVASHFYRRVVERERAL